MRNVVLYIALSLDGYIADEKGGIDWLGGQESDAPEDDSYHDFIAGIDTVIMGHTTYQQIVTELSPEIWPYKGLETFVLTRQPQQNASQVTFVNQPADHLVETLKQEHGRSIWICGGANVVTQLLKKDMIDEFHLTIIPTLLGGGTRLFAGHGTEIPLRLLSSSSKNGMVSCIYRRR